MIEIEKVSAELYKCGLRGIMCIKGIEDVIYYK